MSNSSAQRLALIAAVGGWITVLFLLNFIAQINSDISQLESLRLLFSEHTVLWGLIIFPLMASIAAVIFNKNIQDVTQHSLYFETLLEASPIAIVTLDLDHRIIAANPTFERLFGHAQKDIVGLELDSLITTGELNEQARNLTEGALDGKSVFIAAPRMHKDGTLVDVEVHGVPVIVNGAQIGVLGLYHDVSARTKAEAALRESEEKYRNIFESVIDFLYSIDLQGNIIDANPAFEKVTGYDLDSLLTMKIEDLMPTAHKRFFPYYISKVANKGRSNGILHIQSKTGEEKIVEYKNFLIVGPDGPTGVRGSAREITKRVELENQLKQSLDELDALARTDALTGLFNRRGIYEHLESELRRTERQRIPFSIVLIDLDKLKHINDNYGHGMGDEALLAVSQAILKSIRSYDRVGRHGGDEFLLVLPSSTLSQAEMICQRIATAVAETKASQEGISFSISIGVACFFEDEEVNESLDEVIGRADDALYLAKESGGNQVKVSKLDKSKSTSKK